MRRRFKSLASYKTIKMEGRYICLNCGNVITKKRRKRYCSNPCMNKFAVKNNWQRLSLYLRKKYRKCQLCSHKPKYIWELVTDHITPIYKGGREFDINNLQVLCKDCHKSKTKYDKRKIRVSKHKQLRLHEKVVE